MGVVSSSRRGASAPVGRLAKLHGEVEALSLLTGRGNGGQAIEEEFEAMWCMRAMSYRPQCSAMALAEQPMSSTVRRGRVVSASGREKARHGALMEHARFRAGVAFPMSVLVKSGLRGRAEKRELGAVACRLGDHRKLPARRH